LIARAIKLPEAWAVDPERCAPAGVPDEHRRALATTDLALAEIDRVRAAGARFGRAVADAGWGIGAAFRQDLSGRGLVRAVGVPKVRNVDAPTVELGWPKAATGRPRRHPYRARPRSRPRWRSRPPLGVVSPGGMGP
jgi:hypothetical protein